MSDAVPPTGLRPLKFPLLLQMALPAGDQVNKPVSRQNDHVAGLFLMRFFLSSCNISFSSLCFWVAQAVGFDQFNASEVPLKASEPLRSRVSPLLSFVEPGG